jgi:predicted negative regulator of RcsB-dependent stress response
LESDVDRHLKKVVKSDEFKQQVWHSIDFVKDHRAEVQKYGVIALAVLVVAGGIYFYVNHQGDVREEALAHALRVDQGTVGSNTQAANLHFDTQEDKDKAREKAFREVATKYPGTQEAAISLMNLGQAAVDKGDLAEGEKDFKTVADSAPSAYASQAALALAQLYDIEGRTADAEKLLDNLVKHPTVTVSKDEAELALARVKAKTDPAAARKLLEGLQTTQRTAVSKAAVSELAEIMGRNN